MFAILLNEKGGEQKRLEFDKPEVTIGRVQGNDIILAKGNVSKRHSRIVLKDGKFIIVDLKSTNGTYVNGRKITSPLVVKGTDKIYIGDFIMSIEGAAANAAAEEGDAVRVPTLPPPPPRTDEEEADAISDEVVEDRALGQEEIDAEAAPAHAKRPTLPPPTPPAPRSAPLPPRSAEPSRVHSAAAAAAVAVAPRLAPLTLPPRPVVAPMMPVRRPTLPSPAGPSAAPPRKSPTLPEADGGKTIEALRLLTERLSAALQLPVKAQAVDEGLSARAESTAVALFSDLSGEGLLPSGIDSTSMVRDAVAEVLGAGPLDELIADDSVERVSVARPDRIYVAREGVWQLHRKGFSSAEAVSRAAERLLYRTGQRAPQSSETTTREGTLPNGVHVTAATCALAARGGALFLRRLPREQASLSDLVGRGALSEKMAKLLEVAVRGKHNLVLSGATGSGRSAFLSSLLRVVEGAEVALVEQGAPVDAGQGPVITLRGGGAEARSVLAAAARFSADYLVVGDVQGGEALDLLGAMVGGRTGTLCSVAASSPREALSRFCALSRLAADAPTPRVLADELAGAIKCVVQVVHRGGQLEVSEIAEVTSNGEGGFALRTLFSGRAGHFESRGELPGWAKGDALSSQ